MTSPQTQPRPQQEPPPTQAEQNAPETGPAQRGAETEGGEKHAGGKVVHMHTAHPQLSIPYVTPGDMFTGARTAASRLPSMRKMVFYGALGGMAALEALEWPVALAIGAATEVITREQRQRAAGAQGEQRERPATEPARTEAPGRTEAPRPAQAATG
ncbi:hypothetical protein ACIBVL_02305 [Streptomyces sp. NPDC049687]|uniref:hypothetical protein n=1 Tax=Streptomyces sp. NPDC049687 TaxID=3365596 RepID=UPI00379AC97E